MSRLTATPTRRAALTITVLVVVPLYVHLWTRIMYATFEQPHRWKAYVADTWVGRFQEFGEGLTPAEWVWHSLAGAAYAGLSVLVAVVLLAVADWIIVGNGKAPRGKSPITRQLRERRR